ncbi:kynureninase [Bailinhaonella thermotolerans]|uniref:Kynureninase n=1 Tax=Bailinhaonella thermotolerans TaxID=1070861 RepID=A0A3A4B349_9ACTN|nr:kynureninase [Bailinhaonella thermotolerans]RJL34618.1 kynureninase [Bailinhaonella thermotolerans]
MSREECAELDAADPLAALRAEFELPGGVVYLAGNSLGALPKAAAERVGEMVREEWGRGLVGSWNAAGWFDLPRAAGDRIAPLIGAAPGEVVVGDSTSVNVFKVVAAALGLRPGRRVILSDLDNFPTDRYMIEGAAGALGPYEIRDVTAATLAGALDADVAAVVLSEVDYRTGARYDMAETTRLVQDAGAIMIWDLCHSAGALPVELNACGVDFAVGCTYKYLNGGPGSPAFVFAASRHLAEARQPLSGWHGHAAPFAFEPSYRPAEGATRFLVGTPPVLSYGGLMASLDLWEKADIADVRAKSVSLTSLFIRLVEERCPELELVSPRDPERRGSQVAFRHAEGYAIVRAAIDRGVVGDFRAPDILRFGFAPLYVSHTDVWDAADVLADVFETGAWRDPAYARRLAVT